MFAAFGLSASAQTIGEETMSVYDLKLTAINLPTETVPGFANKHFGVYNLSKPTLFQDTFYGIYSTVGSTVFERA